MSVFFKRHRLGVVDEGGEIGDRIVDRKRGVFHTELFHVADDRRQHLRRHLLCVDHVGHIGGVDSGESDRSDLGRAVLADGDPGLFVIVAVPYVVRHEAQVRSRRPFADLNSHRFSFQRRPLGDVGAPVKIVAKQLYAGGLHRPGIVSAYIDVSAFDLQRPLAAGDGGGELFSSFVDRADVDRAARAVVGLYHLRNASGALARPRREPGAGVGGALVLLLRDDYPVSVKRVSGDLRRLSGIDVPLDDRLVKPDKEHPVGFFHLLHDTRKGVQRLKRRLFGVAGHHELLSHKTHEPVPREKIRQDLGSFGSVCRTDQDLGLFGIRLRAGIEKIVGVGELSFAEFFQSLENLGYPVDGRLGGVGRPDEGKEKLSVFKQYVLGRFAVRFLRRGGYGGIRRRHLGFAASAPRKQGGEQQKKREYRGRKHF